jgi:hypothetical protein
MENVVIFYDHLEYFAALLCTYFMAICGHLVYFPILVCFTDKIWQPWHEFVPLSTFLPQ